MASKPAQNAAGATPVPGSTSLVTNVHDLEFHRQGIEILAEDEDRAREVERIIEAPNGGAPIHGDEELIGVGDSPEREPCRGLGLALDVNNLVLVRIAFQENKLSGRGIVAPAA